MGGGKRRAEGPVPSSDDEWGSKDEGESESEGEREREGSVCSSDASAGSEVDLTFSSYNMDRADYHSVAQFLATTFGRGIKTSKGGECGTVDTTGLARIIVDVLGEYVGTTAKAAEEDGPLAFASLVPLALPDFATELREEGIACLKNVVEILRATARKSGSMNKKQLAAVEEALLDADRTALVLHERFMNLPAEVGAPLYKQLLDDLPDAGEESRCFKPETILLLVPVYRELESQLDQAASGKKSRRMENRPTQVPGDYEYYYAEDELLANISSIHWDFGIKTPHETPDSRRAFGDRGVDAARRVFLLTMAEFGEFVRQCQAFLEP
jgi:hypothetical protein